MMKGYVVSVTAKKFKIFNVVISNIAINMMNYFLRLKKSTKMFFHNKPMFKNIALAVTKRVILHTYFGISFTDKYFTSTFPSRIIASFSHFANLFNSFFGVMTSWKKTFVTLFKPSSTAFFLSFFRHWMSWPSYLIKPVALMGAEFSMTCLIWIKRKFNTTIFTNTFKLSHIISPFYYRNIIAHLGG